MAVVDLKSDAYDSVSATDNTDRDVVDPIRNRFLIRGAIGTVANAATDSDTSVYRLWRMPARAILRPETLVDLQSWGFAAATLGLAAVDGNTLTEDGLLGSQTVSGLSAPSAPIAAFGAKWGLPVWEQAGLAADPGGMVDVIIGTAAGAAGAGTATFDALWQID